MSTRTIETRWRGVLLGTALVVLGGVATADAWCAFEEPTAAGAERGGALARELSRAAADDDWGAIERSLGELERTLQAGVPAQSLPAEALPAEDPAGGLPGADAPVQRHAERMVRRHRVEDRHVRVHRHLRLEPPNGHPGETWEEHWEHFGERVGRHWGRFGGRMGERGEAWGEHGARVGEHWGRVGERIGERWAELGSRAGERWGELGNRAGERWGSFGERAGRRFSRVGDEIGDRFGEIGDDLPDIIDLTIETVVDAVETLIDSLER